MKKNIPLIVKVFIVFAVAAGYPAATGVPLYAQQEEPNLITAVEKVSEVVGPTVVAIKVEKVSQVRDANPRVSPDPYQQQFFDMFFKEFFGNAPTHEQRQSGMGSGVIIDKEGYILTNEHVVRDADQILVRLSDGRVFPAALIGMDARSDLALIKIKAPDLPSAVMGDSDRLKSGQWVVAIGNPFGHILSDPEPAVSAGVISALHRALPQFSRSDSDYSDLIQTDAAINPGNSGGPLVNLSGEVIGINAAIFSTSGGYQGIGFAVPINYAKSIVNQLIKGEEIVYGWIGVSVQDVDARLAQYFKLPAIEGVLVTKALDNAPAQKAGIKDGDIILSVNGVRIRNSITMIKYIATSPVGNSVSVEVLREGKKLAIPVVIEKRPGTEQAMAKIPAETDEAPVTIPDGQNWRGLSIENLSDTEAAQLNVASRNRVMIKEIHPGTPAQDAGLRVGDVIVSINSEPVYTIKDFYKIIQTLKGNALVRTMRGFFVLEAK